MAPTDQDSITVVVALQVCSNCLRILIRKSKIELHVDGFRKWFDGEARPVALFRVGSGEEMRKVNGFAVDFVLLEVFDIGGGSLVAFWREVVA